MEGFLAHQGGWDELLLTAAVVLGFAGWTWIRGRLREGIPRRRAGVACAYCGHGLGPEDARCPECGFRARAG